ncbi:hypothetical protein [Mesorhizobium sp. M1E.F.Ca.ET.045.02.1.1]|uniref:hypothetical protein n=1 Tax=Mesorhizobium sp. M1E.F.Ca.ET.045.02.1.1 TaxID=2493672 RepID=UPI0016767ECC|nr:hypothetical protein [Mesorhizobium sp. M1E.F.Ca.ET.045.02.1.1]
MTDMFSSPLKVSLALSPMFKAEAVRRLLRLGETPTGIFAAAVVLAHVVLHAGRGGVFGLGQSDFVAHGQ